MNKIFEKYEVLFCMLLITLYIVVNSALVQSFGYTSSISFIVNSAEITLTDLTDKVMDLYQGVLKSL